MAESFASGRVTKARRATASRRTWSPRPRPSWAREAFESIHERLLAAYFRDNRDITARSTLAAIWTEAELPAEEFARAEEPRVLDSVLAQHNEAVELGITGVPTVRVAGQEAFVTGAQPYEVYRRWVEKMLAES